MVDGYLLDTNIASALWDELHADHHQFRAMLSDLGAAPVFVSVITLAEIEYGLKVAPRIDDSRQDVVRENMAAFEALSVDKHAAEIYAELRSSLFRNYAPRDSRGRLTAKRVSDLWERTPDRLLGVQENDLWQASVAAERNLVLITNDRMNHIRKVSGGIPRVLLWT